MSGQPFPSPGIFLIQGLNLDLLHCRQILYCLTHQGSPYICVYNAHTHTHKTLKVISAGPLIFFFSPWVHSRIALLSLLQVKYDHVSPSVSKVVWITSRQKLKSPLTTLHALFLSVLTAVFWKAVVAVLLKPH